MTSVNWQADFVREARGLIGVKWRHRGRKPWAVDCIGLIALAAERSHVPFEDERGYGREPWDDQIRKGCRKRWGMPIERRDARAADIAVVRWYKAEPSHLGIIADHPDGGLSIIHAHLIHGVIEQGIDDNMLECIVEVYRIKVSP
jgi:cell wall-associated NlpC family hydrolase